LLVHKRMQGRFGWSWAVGAHEWTHRMQALVEVVGAQVDARLEIDYCTSGCAGD
jgi:hypothetical protein